MLLAEVDRLGDAAFYAVRPGGAPGKGKRTALERFDAADAHVRELERRLGLW